MAAPARFLFDTDFSAPAEPEPVEPEVFEEASDAPLSNHLNALVAAEKRAYARGHADGMEEMTAKARKRMADEAGRLVSAAQGILGALDADRVRIEREAAELARQIAGKLVDHLIAREPTGEIAALIEDCLGPLRQAPHIVVRVEENDADAIKAEVDRIAHERGFLGRLVVLGEPDLARGDCRIEWADGGIVRDRAAIEAEIDAAIETYFRARDGGGPADPAAKAAAAMESEQ
ncbi:flagellar assembly protein FliH [Rhodobium orientis]|uniref:Flagellar assembly protein FliH n=1 Tax=Rhodobium orientis TaxID=34017 RepID=A0A327K3P9_9HYPH|nr:FliH/SctL family protein [Rhodobium orientis]MBB4301227.1 flagellar assembly protein FliH [Rhodobium orientis]MBK5951181.1 hypothetical protein [Rhodobium orientis]RAI30008.1 hypothetical protein CH339_00280 [Rhodobium orientis]